MIIIWGSKTYGRVDRVPGLFHVCTNFGHLYYLPLFPTGSYLRFEMPGYEDRALPISFSFKSLLMCWLRTFLGFFGVISTFVAMSDTGPASQTLPLVLGILAIVGWLVLSFAGFAVNASHDGAQRILEKNGLGDLMGAVDEHFESKNNFGDREGYGIQGIQRDYQNRSPHTGGPHWNNGGDQWAQSQQLTPLDETNTHDR